MMEGGGVLRSSARRWPCGWLRRVGSVARGSEAGARLGPWAATGFTCCVAARQRFLRGAVVARVFVASAAGCGCLMGSAGCQRSRRAAGGHGGHDRSPAEVTGRLMRSTSGARRCLSWLSWPAGVGLPGGVFALSHVSPSLHCLSLTDVGSRALLRRLVRARRPLSPSLLALCLTVLRRPRCPPQTDAGCTNRSRRATSLIVSSRRDGSSSVSPQPSRPMGRSACLPACPLAVCIGPLCCTRCSACCSYPHGRTSEFAVPPRPHLLVRMLFVSRASYMAPCLDHQPRGAV